MTEGPRVKVRRTDDPDHPDRPWLALIVDGASAPRAVARGATMPEALRTGVTAARFVAAGVTWRAEL